MLCDATRVRVDALASQVCRCKAELSQKLPNAELRACILVPACCCTGERSDMQVERKRWNERGNEGKGSVIQYSTVQYNTVGC